MNNHYFKKFKEGIYMAAASFSLIWRYKYLLIYFAIPTLIAIGLHLSLYNMLVTPIEKQLPVMAQFHEVILSLLNVPNWFYYIVAFFLFFLFILVEYFFNAALIYRTMHLLKNEKTSLVKSIVSCFPKLTNIALWSLIASLQVSIVQLLNKAADHIPSIIGYLFILVGIIINIFWSILTFLVLLLIILEKTTVTQAIVRSGIIVWKRIFKIFGGQVWFMLISVLSLTPFLIHLHFSYIIPPNYFKFLHLIGTILAISIRCIIASGRTIFKTMVYDQYIRPEQEIDYLKYPHL